MGWALLDFECRSPGTGASDGVSDGGQGQRQRRPPATAVERPGCGIAITQVFGLMRRQVMPRSLHPNSATGYCGWSCRSRCNLSLFRMQVTAAVADAVTSSAHFSISCNSG